MIRIEHLACAAGDFRLSGINFTVAEGEYFVTLGPTGAGKTVLLECIAGLHPNPPGSVRIGGQDVSSWMPEKRNIGYVPQDYGLFPFMTVEENILFPLRLRSGPDGDGRAAVREAIELLHIDHLLGRNPASLSGGERQRVALARALAVRPRLLLMDEPYSAIHGGLRRKLWLDMKILHARFNTTVIHVTHDLEEAFALGRRAAVLAGGSIMQVGTREHILRNPANRRVAEFLGMVNIFAGEVAGVDAERGYLDIVSGGRRFVAPRREGIEPGQAVEFCIHADRLRLNGEARYGAAGGYAGVTTRVIDSINHRGGRSIYLHIDGSRCSCREYDLELQLPDTSPYVNLCRAGSTLEVTIPASAVHVFRGQPPNSGADPSCDCRLN